LVHYILHGAAQGLDPHPLFDTSFYLQQYADVSDSGVNPLKHYVQHGQLEERLPRNIFLDSVAHSLMEFYPLLHEIEPLLPPLDELNKLRVRNSLKTSRAGVAYFKLANSLDKPFTRLVLVGDVSASHWQHCDLINSLVDEYGADSVLVIAADSTAGSLDEAFTERLPFNTRFIGQDQLPRELTLFERMIIVLRLVLQAAPEAVYNCGSELCPIIFREYGRQLTDVTSLINCTFPSARDGHARSLLGCRPAQSATAACDLSETTCDDRSFDISVIVNCHVEGNLLLPTISAASLAVERARNSQVTVEWLFVLDRADEVTRRCLKEHMPVDGRTIETSLGDPGLARNAGVLASRGEFVAFMDGDDLFSPNWLEAAYNFSSTLVDNPVILHPFGTIFFGDTQFINLYYDSEDPDFSRTALMEDSLWLSNSFAKRTVYLLHPYRPSDFQKGFDFEDWQWNCDTVASGIAHKLVPDTFFCYRVKPGLTSRNARAHSCILGKSRLFDLKFQVG